MITLVDGTVPVANDFNSNYTALNQVCGTTTAITGYTTGDIVYASAATALSKLGIGKAGQFVGVSSGLPAYGAHFAGHIFGLTLSNSAGDATNDIDVAVGEAVSVDTTFGNRVVMALTTAITKQLDAAWAVGTNAGGLDTGAIANTTYHVWQIMRSDTSVVDVLFSTSASAPTMPTNYDKKRIIGSIVRTGGAIKAFTQWGDDFFWTDPPLDIDVATSGTSAVSATLTVPTGRQVIALINLLSGNTSLVYVSPLSSTDSAPSSTAAPLASGGTPAGVAADQVRVLTNTSAQVRYRASGNNALRIATVGWFDSRGRYS